ncbi:MAG: Endonuclease III [Parcubacteria group bacterium GW2011_GWA2_51_10]|nr:MAG: Endonuclease III [Parcubacteria group bacterium GW2011_GWA2_51_10]
MTKEERAPLEKSRRKTPPVTAAARRSLTGRAREIVAYLKKAYPKPKSELKYQTPFQFLVAVILSAQCTDKAVNRLTDTLFGKYKTALDFARAKSRVFEKEISAVPFFRNKSKNIIAAAKKTLEEFDGRVPRNAEDLQTLPGVGYKTAHVVAGELFDIWEGIPTDTHVRRFALRFGLTKHSDLGKISKDFETLVPRRDWKYVNNGLVLYGRYVCPARSHDCTKHPLTKLWPEAAANWPRAK